MLRSGCLRHHCNCGPLTVRVFRLVGIIPSGEADGIIEVDYLREISTLNRVSCLSAQVARTTKWLPLIGFATGMEMTSKCSGNPNIP